MQRKRLSYNPRIAIAADLHVQAEIRALGARCNRQIAIRCHAYLPGKRRGLWPRHLCCGMLSIWFESGTCRGAPRAIVTSWSSVLVLCTLVGTWGGRSSQPPEQQRVWSGATSVSTYLTSCAPFDMQRVISNQMLLIAHADYLRQRQFGTVFTTRPSS